LREYERALWLAEQERRCRLLWLAVLGQAAQDTVAHWDLSAEDQAAAIKLFERENEALELLCELAGVVPDRVRKAYMRGELADFSLSAIGRKRYETRRRNKKRKAFADAHGIDELKVMFDLFGEPCAPSLNLKARPSRKREKSAGFAR
jgi:hypothetical protein